MNAQLFGLVCLSHLSYTVAIRCVNDQGTNVDWFMALKQPSDTTYGIMTDSDTFQLSTDTLDTKTNAVVRTIDQAWSSTVNSVFYNDEFPDGRKYGTGGHAKGVVVWDSSSGFWMVHSVPKYPAATGSAAAGCCPSDTYAQSFLCVSFSSVDAPEIIEYLMGIEAKVYYNHTKNSNVWDNAFTQETNYTNIFSLYSYAYQKFTVIGRSADADLYLYEDMVAPAFDQGLTCETWQNGGQGKSPDFCTPKYKYSVMNVDSISLLSFGGMEWNSTKDHSKWAITGAPNAATSPYAVCIGDINRQPTQVARGGGTVCLALKSVWSVFAAIINTFYEC